mgnify:CR=1 FL=1
MSTSERTTARVLASEIRSGARSARTVLEEHLAAIDAREREVNAFNLVLADEARIAADAIDARVAAGEDPGPLAGVPVALKDNMCTRGVPTTCSSRILEGWRPPYDATVVERLVAAGAVVVGKTNLDEFAMGSSTENSAFGVTRNPLDPTKVPGGSSGGSAAAVAAGFTPLALGSDTGGSIRQPAALCGVVGVKPTYGAVSRYGLVAFASSLDQIGPFSRTVADSALMLEVIGGHDRRDSTSIPEPAADLSSVLDHGVEGLRIGIIEELSGDGLEGIADDVRARLHEAVAALEAAGATVASTSVPSTVYGLSAYYVVAPAEASSNLARYDGVRFGLRVDAPNAGDMNSATRTAGFGDEVKRRIMLGTYALSSGYYDAYYLKAQKVRQLIKNDFDKAFKDVDAILTPSTPSSAFKIGDKSDDPVSMYLNDIFTVPVNLSGLPAISVPAGYDKNNLPLGLQLIGKPFDEQTILNLSLAIEKRANFKKNYKVWWS